ncbi:MAG: PAS domain S-box protein, partial [Solirubrobacterales bacterium]
MPGAILEGITDGLATLDLKLGAEDLRRLSEELERRVQKRTADLTRINAALRQAGAYDRSLIEASLDPLVTIGPDGRITDVNLATERVTGCTRDELIGSDFSQYFTEPEKANEGYRKVFREGTVQDYPLEIRHKDGGITSVLYNAAVYRNQAGEAIGVFAAARDVTEVRRTEQAMRNQRQRFNDVLEKLPAYLILLTPDHHVSFANRFFRERFGESHGRRCFEYLFHRAEPCEVCETYKVLESGVPHHWEWAGPDGRIYDIHDFPFTDTDGSPLIMEMGIDITERKIAEEALREANETLERRVEERTAAVQEANLRLQAQTQELQAVNQELHAQAEELSAQEEELRTANDDLRLQQQAIVQAKERWERTFHNVPDMIAIVDSNHLVIQANRAMAERLGLTPEQCVGLPCYRLLHGTEAPPAFCPHAKTLEDGREHTTEIHEGRLGGDFLVSTTPLRDEHGHMIGSVHVARDITEQKQAERKILRQTMVLRGISRIFQEAMSARTEEELGRVCLSVAEEITQSRFGFIGEINAQGLEDIAISNPGWDACTMVDQSGRRGPAGSFKIHGLYGRVLRDGQSLFTNDPAAHPDSIGTPEGHPPLTAFLGVPLIREDRTIGIVAVGNREGGYSQDELEAVESLAPAIVEAFLRKRAEQALAASERKYRALIETTNSVIIRWNRQGVLQFINERGAHLLGYEPHELIGQPVTILVPEVESTGRPLVSLVQDIIDHPDQHTYNPNENVRKDGTRVWIAWTNRAITDEEGTVQEVLAVGNEITALKNAEASLRESGERFRLLSETAANLLAAENPLTVVDDLCGKIMDHLDCQAFFNFIVDEKAGRLHLNACAGIPRKEARRIEWLDYGAAVCGCVARDGRRIVAEDIPSHPNSLTDLVASYGITAYACHPLLAGDKVIGTLSFGTRTRQRFSDEDLSLMKTVADQVAVAMERIRSRQALLESERQLRLALEGGRMGLWEWDHEGHGDFWDERVHELLGLDRSVAPNLDTFLRYVDKRDVASLKENMQKSFAGDGEFQAEFRIIRVSGEITWVMSRGRVIRNAPDAPARMLGVLLDITQRKLLEEQLRRLNDQLEEEV